MRRKLYLGLALATCAIVAGAFTLNQTIGAQDAPKKAEPEQKKSDQDLFDVLRQKFEAKPEAPPVTPPLPLPTAQGVAPLPLPTAQAPTPIPPQTRPSADANLPTPGGTTLDVKPLNETKAKAPPMPAPQPLQPVPGSGGLPTPPVTGVDSIPGVPNLPGSNGTGGPLPPAPQQPPQPKPEVYGDKLVPPIGNPTPNKEPIKLKGSVWSLYVEMVNGQTIVTATVNKKHEFKIVCQNIDLQTAAGVMKARGKVQISGDGLDGSCDQLTLPLHDDCLVLEGAADVRIQKTSANVSATRSAAFELKGDKLDLRISELRTSAYIETSWRKVSDDSSEVRTVPASMRPGDSGKTWTTYGILRNTKSNDGNVWSLVSSEGQVIAYVMARDGGSLEQYVGRTIAVYGAREGERAGHPLVRVSHIAVP